ncbi:hypothetical protein Hanom_Chr09g00780311 [Helianthus anomalus]
MDPQFSMDRGSPGDDTRRLRIQDPHYYSKLTVVSIVFKLVLQLYSNETWSYRDSRGICLTFMHVQWLHDRCGDRGGASTKFG